MKKHLHCLVLFFALAFPTEHSMGQEEAARSPIAVGEPCPIFSLQEVHYYPMQSASLKDFSDKWLILDFWTQGCVLCVESFPKVNALQAEFKNDIQFLLVGKDDFKSEGGIRAMYDRFRTRQNLHLAIAYDTLLFNQFDVKFTPHIVVIDRRGVVRGILDSSTLTKENLQLLLANDNINIPQQRVVFHDDESSVDDVVKSDKRFSELKRWDGRKQGEIMMSVTSDGMIGHYKSTRISLKRLYNLAYLGYAECTIENNLYAKQWRLPIIEVKDTSAFEEDRISGEGFYSYELFIPEAEASRENMMKAIQVDLQKYFKYNVSFENRLMPCWRLEVYDKNKIRHSTSSNTKSRMGDHSGYVLKSIPISDLIALIRSYHQRQPPFVDETSLQQPIDINLQAIMTDLKDISRALKENGLQLVRGERLMRVLVIREPN